MDLEFMNKGIRGRDKVYMYAEEIESRKRKRKDDPEEVVESIVAARWGRNFSAGSR